MDLNMRTNEAFEIAKVLGAVCLGIIAIFGPTVFVARWILTPIDRAAKSREAPVRFSIGDFFCLFILIQIPLAAIFRLQDGTGDSDVNGGLWFLTAVLWGVGTVIWYAGARTLSKAGVATSGHRFVYLGLILPLVYYGLVPYTLLWGAGVGVLFENEFPLRTIGWGFAAWTILTVLYVLSALFTRWMLRCEQSIAGEPLEAAPESGPTIVAAATAECRSHHQSASGSTTPDSGSMTANGQPSHSGCARLQ